MKKIILALGALAIISSQVMAAENKTAIGVGAGVALSPYQGVGTTGYPIPFFDIRYEGFYLRGAEIGYDIIQEDAFTASLFVNPLGGYKVDGSDLDRGYDKIDDRDYQVEGGLKLSYNTGWNNVKVGGFFAFGEEGNLGGINTSRRFVVTDNFSLTPQLYLNFLSEDYTDYYFGVTTAERDRNSKIGSAYNPDSAYAFGLNVAGEYLINEYWSMVGFVALEKLSSEIDDSPIVEEDLLYKVGLGVKYTF